MDAKSHSFLTWAKDLWDQQGYSLRESPSQFGKRDTVLFLRQLASEYKKHRKGLLAAFMGERKELEKLCVVKAKEIQRQVGVVNKYKYRALYPGLTELPMENGKLSKRKMRAARKRTDRSTGVIKSLATFVNQWTETLDAFAGDPLGTTPFRQLGLPRLMEIETKRRLGREPTAQIVNSHWEGLYPAGLLLVYRAKKALDKKGFILPLQVWCEAYERITAQVSELYSAVELSPWALAQTLDFSLGQDPLGSFLSLESTTSARNALRWQIQIVARFEQWLSTRVTLGLTKRKVSALPILFRPIRWTRSSRTRGRLLPEANSLQATVWFVGFLLHELCNRPKEVPTPSTQGPKKRRKPPKNWRKHAEHVMAKGNPISASQLARQVGVATSTVTRDKTLRSMCVPDKVFAKGIKSGDGYFEAYLDRSEEE